MDGLEARRRDRKHPNAPVPVYFPVKSFSRGGKVRKTNVYKLHKGEKVVPAKHK